MLTIFLDVFTVLTRIRQDESVASEGSSFTRELGRLNRAISCSTGKSLVLLDEVGRECRSDGQSNALCSRIFLGVLLTIDTDGAGLFIATIHEFLKRGKDCPIVLSATHHLRKLHAENYLQRPAD